MELERDYMNIDPRQLQEFMRIPDFMQSLTPEQYSGMTRRVLTAR